MATPNTDIERQHIKRMLRRLRRCPFVALVVDDGKVHLYHRNIGPEMIAMVRETLAEMQEET